MGRDLAAGPFTTRKIRKETKTAESRIIPMGEGAIQLLHSKRLSSPNQLVFSGAKGGIMDTRAFREVWEKVLLGLNLEYRNPYQCRHTCLSIIAQEHGLLAASKVAGHKSVEITARHYARFVGDLKDVMPEF